MRPILLQKKFFFLLKESQDCKDRVISGATFNSKIQIKERKNKKDIEKPLILIKPMLKNYNYNTNLLTLAYKIFMFQGAVLRNRILPQLSHVNNSMQNDTVNLIFTP